MTTLCVRLLIVWMLASFTAFAGVRVTIDADALNELLPALLQDAVSVPITENNSLDIRLRELRILGFDPAAAGSTDAGRIRAAAKVEVSQLGLTLPVEPTLQLSVSEEDGQSVLVLRFLDAELPLPFGAVDVAGVLPPLLFPADNVFELNGATSDVSIHSRLIDIQLGERDIQFEFDLRVVPTE